MKAINFYWRVEKMTIGLIYDFTADGEQMTIKRTGAKSVEVNGVSVEVFRDAMIVADCIGIALKRAASLRSGDAPYKYELLKEMRPEYSNGVIYTGVASPSAHPTLNKKIGQTEPKYLGFELEVVERNPLCYRALAAFESNIWHMVTDSSIANSADQRAGLHGIEFVSTLLDPQDAVKPAFFEPFCAQLSQYAKSRTKETTGLHCHASREFYGESEEEQNDNITKLIFLVNFVLSDCALTKVFGRGAGDWCQQNRSTTGIVEHVKAVTDIAGKNVLNDKGIRDAFKRDLLAHNKSRDTTEGHYTSSRYFQVNITNQHTVEFRRGKGSINSEDIAIIAQFVCTVSAYVCNTKLSNLSEAGYIKSIPNSAKYARLRGCFAGSND
jgi:hypothetical protein